MEFQQVFVTFAIIMVGVVSIFGLLGFWNTAYNANVGGNFSSTASHIQYITGYALNTTSTTAANSTTTQSGAGGATAQTNLATRAINILQVIPNLLGLPNAVLQDASNMVGLPTPNIYVDIANYVFMFGFVLLFAYLLIIGVRRLV